MSNITYSAFGPVFGIVDGTSHPVCDYAGFAPLDFGYRRCPGEQLTINVFEDFLRKVWRDKIVFRKLNLANPGRVPIGPNAVIAACPVDAFGNRTKNLISKCRRESFD